MKWIKKISQIHEKGIVGKCPYCNSADTDYMYFDKGDNRSFLHIWCNSCAEQVHVDGGAIPHNRKHMNFERVEEHQRIRKSVAV